MKKNMKRVMDLLCIDRGIEELIAQMWRHGYRTTFSCEGDNGKPYVSFLKGTGDGWFEHNASAYGLKKIYSCAWCDTMGKSCRFCNKCGAGLKGDVLYRGTVRLSRTFVAERSSRLS